MRRKRTRHIHKPYFLTVPRIRIEDCVYEIKLKVSQVTITKVKDVPNKVPKKDDDSPR